MLLHFFRYVLKFANVALNDINYPRRLTAKRMEHGINLVVIGTGECCGIVYLFTLAIH